MFRLTALSGAAVLAAGLSLPGPALAAADVTVPCPGAMVDSSAAIISALQSIGPGGTVRLEACTYYLSAPIVVTGTFDGALVGAGMGRTILTTLPDADGIEDVLMLNWISDLDTPGTPGPTLAPTLFHFSLFGDTPSRVAMSNMTIAVTDPNPAPYSARVDFFSNALLAIVTVEGLRVSTDFDQLDMKAVPSGVGFPGTNVFYGVEMWGELSHWPDPGTERPMQGRHVQRRSVFDGFWVGHNCGNMVDSSVVIRNNRFSNGVYDAIDPFGMPRSALHVTQNDLDLNSTTGGVGIWVTDVSGALINQNRMTGRAQLGIVAGGGEGYLILNNDFEGLVVPPGSFLVVLEAATSNSLVVGTNPAQVLDLGTNNKILGGKGKH